MKEPKNIERLFQEKLKDLEMTPPPAVWNKIEQSIATPKKSKKGFIWWFSGSAAALFLLGFFLFKNYNHVKPLPIALQKEPTSVKKTDSTSVNNNPTKNVESSIAYKSTDTETSNTKEIASNIIKKEKNNPENQTIYKKTKSNINNNSEKEYTSKTTPKTSEETVIVANKTEVKSTISADESTPNSTFTTTKKQNLATVVNKETAIPKNNKQYWSIAPVVSELFYNTLSNKSPVDSRLDNATKNGESSTSFGLKIAYQASKKWRIQTGIHKIDLAQTTENIAIASISRTSSFQNSSQTISSSNIINDQEISTSENTEISNDLVQNPTNENTLRQSFGYIEVPIEVNYQLFETNKFQFHIIGGMSSLFLTTNNLQMENPNYSYSSGEATNLNQVNFSFNLGSAVEYHFTNRWFFNLSPMLKMQTQTFNNTDNKPYLLGVSTGLNYKF